MTDTLRLPDFIIIGAMKCGTSTLRYALHSHPEVFMVYPGEPRFFFLDKAWNQGLGHYAHFFQDAGEAKVVGEGSGFYSWKARNPETVERMAHAIPQTRIIYMVRHPLERMFSHWSWEVANGKPVGSFARAINKYSYYIEMSLYFEQLSAYREYFSDDKIKILFLEDLKRDPDYFYRDCYNFLGVNPSLHNPAVNTQVVNKTTGRLTDTFLLRTISTLPGMDVMRKNLPKGIGNVLKPLMKTKRRPTFILSDELRDELERRVIPDSLQFLEYAGKPPSFWNFKIVP